MRNFALLLMVIPLVFINCQQSADVPATVQEKFTEMFHDATDISWEQEGDEFAASFTFEGKEWEAEFNKDGSWLESEREIEESELPKPVMEYVKKEFNDYEIEAFEFEKNPEGDFYEVELEKEGEQIELYFDLEGKLVKTEKEDEDDQDNED